MKMSLAKIGNIKIGITTGNKAVMTDRILVTKTIKNGEKNFLPYEQYKEGAKSLKVTLPFDEVDLNFEIHYTSFMQLTKNGENIEYILKAKDFGKNIIAYPMGNYENEPCIDMGILDDTTIQQYEMEKTGLLRVYVDGISSIGEVFYFKTKSEHTMKTIYNQLQIISALNDGILAGVPMQLTIRQREVVVAEDKEKDTEVAKIYPYLTISPVDMYLNSEANVNAKNTIGNVSALEKIYKKERGVKKDNIILIKDINKDNWKIHEDKYKEVETLNNIVDAKEVSSFIQKFIKERNLEHLSDIQLDLFLKIVGGEEFLKWFDSQKDEITVLTITKAINQYKKGGK